MTTIKKKTRDTFLKEIFDLIKELGDLAGSFQANDAEFSYVIYGKESQNAKRIASKIN